MLSELTKNYIQTLKPLDSDLDYIVKEAEKINVPIISTEVSHFLKTLILMKKPKRVCEIGTGFGMSTISMAEHMEKGGVLKSCDLSKGSITFVKKEVDRRSMSPQILLFNKSGLDFLKELKEKKEDFDFYFIDAVKSEYISYLDLILCVAKKGAVLVFDNVLWKGEVAGNTKSKKAEFLRQFNSYFVSHTQMEGVILTVGDGIALAVVR